MNPDAAMSTIVAIPDEDYNEPSVERQEILNRLHEALGEVPKHFWAACHVCDVQRLCQLAEVAVTFPSLVRTMASRTTEMIDQCELSLCPTVVIPHLTVSREPIVQGVWLGTLVRGQQLCPFIRYRRATETGIDRPSYQPL